MSIHPKSTGWTALLLSSAINQGQ